MQRTRTSQRGVKRVNYAKMNEGGFGLFDASGDEVDTMSQYGKAQVDSENEKQAHAQHSSGPNGMNSASNTEGSGMYHSTPHESSRRGLENMDDFDKSMQEMQEELRVLELEEKSMRIKIAIEAKRQSLKAMDAELTNLRKSTAVSTHLNDQLAPVTTQASNPSDPLTSLGSSVPASNPIVPPQSQFSHSSTSSMALADGRSQVPLHINKPIYSQPLHLQQGVMPTSSGFDVPPGLFPPSLPSKYGQTRQMGIPPDRLDLNPQVYLNLPHMTSATGTKYRAIIDFIPKNARLSDEDIELADGLILKLKPNASKVRLENVTPAQWVVANANIFADMVHEFGTGDLYNMALDYMSYTSKIGELATRYTWTSVIKYDDEYRAKQHKFGFRWGSDSSHMSVVSLEERRTYNQSSSGGSRRFGKRPDPKDQSSSSPICFNFNAGRACHFSPCKFRHVCEVCEKMQRLTMRQLQSL